MACALAKRTLLPEHELDEPGPASQTRVIRTAVVLQKSTKWEFEKERNPSSPDIELLAQLKKRGEDVEKIKQNDAKQKEAVKEIVKRLKQHGIAVRTVNRKELAGHLDWADIVISAGGDGTFLAAAAAVNNNSKPVIGINTDPIGSEGHLCIGGKNPPNDLIERLLSGSLKCTRRSRIRVTLLNGNLEKDICSLALNEVFVGEDEAAIVSTYEISIDDTPMVKQKSSGLIVSTGSGSTSWFYGMNRVEDSSVLAILEAMQSMGLGVNGASNKELSSEIAKRINDKIPFEIDHPNFAYYIREPIFNATFKRTPVRGFARKIQLRSKCTNGYLVLDSATKIPFNPGMEVLLEIRPEDALLTYTLP